MGGCCVGTAWAVGAVVGVGVGLVVGVAARTAVGVSVGVVVGVGMAVGVAVLIGVGAGVVIGAGAGTAVGVGVGVTVVGVGTGLNVPVVLGSVVGVGCGSPQAKARTVNKIRIPKRVQPLFIASPLSASVDKYAFLMGYSLGCHRCQVRFKSANIKRAPQASKSYQA